MRLSVWNSQGSNGGTKWDTFYTQYLQPAFFTAPLQATAGLLVESGRPPWYDFQRPLHLGTIYDFDTSKTYFEQNALNPAPGGSSFSRGIAMGGRSYKAFWSPWLRTLDTNHQNLRCSFGGALIPAFGNPLRGWLRSRLSLGPATRRPTIRLDLLGGGQLVIFLVHLVSGNAAAAIAQRNLLVTNIQARVFQGYAALIVGDMNIPLPAAGPLPPLPPGWFYIRTGGPTHRGSAARFGSSTMPSPGTPPTTSWRAPTPSSRRSTTRPTTPPTIPYFGTTCPMSRVVDSQSRGHGSLLPRRP